MYFYFKTCKQNKHSKYETKCEIVEKVLFFTFFLCFCTRTCFFQYFAFVSCWISGLVVVNKRFVVNRSKRGRKYVFFCVRMSKLWVSCCRKLSFNLNVLTTHRRRHVIVANGIKVVHGSPLFAHSLSPTDDPNTGKRREILSSRSQ